MILIWFFAGFVGVSFLLIVFRGAPFVPTRRQDITKLFNAYSFKKHDLLVDLGSGDGRVLTAAATRGIRSVGYELNPFLVIYSRLKIARYGELTSVRLEDFWLSKLPNETTVVFVFLATPFMKKLDRKLTSEAKRLGQDITLISYGMKLADKKAVSERNGFITYRYKSS